MHNAILIEKSTIHSHPLRTSVIIIVLTLGVSIMLNSKFSNVIHPQNVKFIKAFTKKNFPIKPKLAEIANDMKQKLTPL